MKNRLKLCLLSTRSGSRRQWILLVDFRYYHIKVPAGFRTDLASVPRAIWSITSSPSEAAEAAVVHDYLYATKKVSRKEADQILYDLAKPIVGNYRARLAWLLVRLFGKKAYEN